jgi:hypothetical protein
MLLAEQFLLFQLDTDKGTPVAAYNGKNHRSSQDDVAGAIFLELALRGRLAMDGLPRGPGRTQQKHELTDHIRSVIFGSTPLDQRTAALIVLLDVCWLMLGDIIGNKEEKAYRKRFEQLFPDDLDWLADYETDMGSVLVESVARPSSNAMSAILIALGNEFGV